MLKELLYVGAFVTATLLPSNTQQNYIPRYNLEVHSSSIERSLDDSLEYAMPDGLLIRTPADSSVIDPRMLRILETLGPEFMANWRKNYSSR